VSVNYINNNMSSSLLTTMKVYYKTFLPLVAAAASSPSNPSNPTTTNPPTSIPRLSTQQIRTASSEFDLHTTLRESSGVLRIAYDEGQANVRRNALENLCACPTFGPAQFGEAAKLHPKDLQEIFFPDGTARRTLASATVGFDDASVLELPSWLKDECGLAALQSFEDLRDIVADVVDLFVDRLDQESGGELHGVGGESKTYRDVLSQANHLEHFHAYTKPAVDGVDQSGDVTLDYHTDAGFFLSFVPAMDCDSLTTDKNSFYLKGNEEPVVFEDDEVVIMIGAGAQYWLNAERTSGEFNEHSPFIAASHALRMQPNTHRSWYGKMHLLPSSLSAPSESVNYGAILPSLKLENYKANVPSAPVDGCGTTLFNDEIFPLAAASPIRTSRRRLQHVNSPASCNNVTNFFCWHQCVAIPESENAEAYVYDGYSLYCLDPSKLGSEDPVKAAAEPCENGFVHNSACRGSWQVTDPDVPGYPLPYEVASESKESEVDETDGEVDSSKLAFGPPEWEEMYCYGGTSMYMDGFTWQGTTCVIFLFRSWVLTTPGQFAAACFGTILFGIALEVVLFKRKAVYAMEPGNLRLFLSVVVYGLQLSMGYFIMLIIMTYSGPLFICTVGGLMIGHVVFNAQDSYMRRRESITEDEDCPCTTEHTGSEKTNELLSYQNSTPESSLHKTTSVSTGEEYGDCCGEPGDVAQDHGFSGRGAIKRATKKKSKSKIAANDDGATPCCRFDM